MVSVFTDLRDPSIVCMKLWYFAGSQKAFWRWWCLAPLMRGDWKRLRCRLLRHDGIYPKHSRASFLLGSANAGRRTAAVVEKENSVVRWSIRRTTHSAVLAPSVHVFGLTKIHPCARALGRAFSPHFAARPFIVRRYWNEPLVAAYFFRSFRLLSDDRKCLLRTMHAVSTAALCRLYFVCLACLASLPMSSVTCLKRRVRNGSRNVQEKNLGIRKLDTKKIHTLPSFGTVSYPFRSLRIRR